MTQPDTTHACLHCDATHEHEHVDTFEVVDARRAGLQRFSWVRLVLACVAVLAVGVAAGPTAALASIGSGAAAWSVATAAGLLVGWVTVGRHGVSGSAAERRLVTTTVLAGAAATPLAALAVSLLSPAVAAGWLLACGAAAGWFAVAAGTEVAHAHRLRALLAEDTRPGEVARENAVRTRHEVAPVRDLAGTVLSAALVGLYVLALVPLPVVVVVLVPLHVALVVLARRSRTTAA